MSGFEARWLELREGADHAARDPGLRQRVIDHINGSNDDAPIVDLGCGTGSTFRALLPQAARWRWRLVDNDPALLAEADARHGAEAGIEFVAADLSSLSPDMLADARLVTASALFDLCSEDFVRNLAKSVGRENAGLYAALNYDGYCVWDTPHPADAEVVAAFNMHQRTDKGFGRALGPDSGPCLKAVLQAAGFRVLMEKSPWRLDQARSELQRRFVDGMADAAAETGSVQPSTLGDWRRIRLERTETSACTVGHWDVLALR